MRIVMRDLMGPIIHELTPEDFAFRAKALGQASPRLLDGRNVLCAIQHPMIDAPGQAEAEESRTAGFGIGELLRIIQVRPPQTIGSMTFDQLCRLPAKDVEITLPAGIVLGKNSRVRAIPANTQPLPRDQKIFFPFAVRWAM